MLWSTFLFIFNMYKDRAKDIKRFTLWSISSFWLDWHLGLVAPGQFSIVDNHIASTNGKNHDQDCNWAHNDGMLPRGLLDGFSNLSHLWWWLGFPWLWRLGLVVNHLDQFFSELKVFVLLSSSIWDTLAVSQNLKPNLKNVLN